VVFLVAMPLCLGIALASGAPVATGLVTGIVGGIVVGSFSGSPLQVSGPAAGLTVVCAEIIRQHGMAGLGAITLLAGGIQLTAGIARIGKWFTAVSPAVIHGMLSGIGVLILAGQLHVLVDGAPQGSGVKNLLALPASLSRGLAAPNWGTAQNRRPRLDLLQTLNRRLTQQAAIRSAVDRQLALSATRTANFPADGKTPQTDWSGLAADQSQLLADLQGDIKQIQAALPADDPLVRSLQEPWQRAEPALANAAVDLQAGAAAQLPASQSQALAEVRALLDSQKDHPSALLLGVLTLVLIVLWNRYAKGGLRAIPGALLGIVCASLVAAWLELPMLHVNVPDDLTSDLTWFRPTALLAIPPRELVIGGLMLAAIASAETLLCANAVDKMHAGPRTRYNQELLAQGVGNVICGGLGVLPMTGVIVRSASNVQAGAKSRRSAILHGVWLVVFVILLKDLVRMIPIAALAGILVYTGLRLIDIKGFRKLWTEHRAGAWIFLVTVTVIVVDDLLTGVITGIVLTALKLLWRFSAFDAELSTSNGRLDLRLQGAATFLRLPLLTDELAKIPAGKDVHAHLEELTLVDHACLELLIDWGKQYEAGGGRFHIDWDVLHSRFRPSQRGEVNRSIEVA
jgi:MFS superfamily sulfate permease-like transporter